MTLLRSKTPASGGLGGSDMGGAALISTDRATIRTGRSQGRPRRKWSSNSKAGRPASMMRKKTLRRVVRVAQMAKLPVPEAPDPT